MLLRIASHDRPHPLRSAPGVPGHHRARAVCAGVARMTPAQEITTLRAEVRELREELEEWRRFSDARPDTLRVYKWRQILKCHPQGLKVGMILADAPGRFFPTHDLHDRITESAKSEKLVTVAVWRLRKALAAHGLRNCVRNEYATGYYMTREGAKAVKALVGE